jgi:type IV pilus assembly protein PilO
MSRKSFDLKNLDFNNTGSWPVPVKLAACALLSLVLIGLAWYLFVTERRDNLALLERKELELRETFRQKQGQAANLEPLKIQLQQMETMLQQMLRQLPSKTEMPALIEDISQTALAAGIANRLFQPGADVAQDYYVEKPITLEMAGTYHQFGAFVSGVASLPRVVIMTMHDIALQEDANGVLLLKGTVKTYRYRDESDAAPAEPASGGTAGGR